jgi:hypothetical protein
MERLVDAIRRLAQLRERVSNDRRPRTPAVDLGSHLADLGIGERRGRNEDEGKGAQRDRAPRNLARVAGCPREVLGVGRRQARIVCARVAAQAQDPPVSVAGPAPDRGERPRCSFHGGPHSTARSRSAFLAERRGRQSLWFRFAGVAWRARARAAGARAKSRAEPPPSGSRDSAANLPGRVAAAGRRRRRGRSGAPQLRPLARSS